MIGAEWSCPGSIDRRYRRSRKGAAIGAAVGAAVGTGAGVLIGKKMDKAAAQAEQIEGAQVEQVTDNNGLQAVKVTFQTPVS